MVSKIVLRSSSPHSCTIVLGRIAGLLERSCLLPLSTAVERYSFCCHRGGDVGWYCQGMCQQDVGLQKPISFEVLGAQVLLRCAPIGSSPVQSARVCGYVCLAVNTPTVKDAVKRLRKRKVRRAAVVMACLTYSTAARDALVLRLPSMLNVIVF